MCAKGIGEAGRRVPSWRVRVSLRWADTDPVDNPAEWPTPSPPLPYSTPPCLPPCLHRKNHRRRSPAQNHLMRGVLTACQVSRSRLTAAKLFDGSCVVRIASAPRPLRGLRAPCASTPTACAASSSHEWLVFGCRFLFYVSQRFVILLEFPFLFDIGAVNQSWRLHSSM